MKINQIVEAQAELNEGPIGQAIAKGVGSVAKGVSAVAGGAVGAYDKAKQGFQAGRAAVSGQPAPTTAATTAPANVQDPAAPATTAPTTAPAAGQVSTAPASGAKGTADFGTIQRSIKSLSPNQKTALSNQLAGKPATTPAAPATTTAPPATNAAAAPAAPTGPQKGQEVSLGSGEKYRFAGQQWVEIDPTTGAEVGGAALPAGFQKSLTGMAAQQASAATDGTPNLKVVDGGKAAVAEGFYWRSKFLNIVL